MSGEQTGPVMDPQICQWLDSGAVFPEFLIFQTEAGKEQESHRYEILDRNADGVIQALKGARRGKKGFVLRVRDTMTQQELAAKLCIPSDYDDGSSPLSEVQLAQKLHGGGDFIHLPKGLGLVENFVGQPTEGEPRPWVCFLSDWLSGKTLQDFVNHAPDEIDPKLAAKIAETLIIAVLFFEKRGLKHDDLHLGNIMLVPSDRDLLEIDPLAEPWRLKIIDLGSVKEFSRLTKKPDDDWSSVARCLAELHNALHGNRAVASHHPEFLCKLGTFVKDLADDDLSRNFPAPANYITRIREVADSLIFMPQRAGTFRPFDAISAEHLASDQLLLNLFVSHLPWISLVQEPEPMVLIGPRGCGKSMVFRYLAVRTHIASAATHASALDRLRFFGVYIGCANELGNDLLWLARDPERPKRVADSITTYFNLILARELLRSLAMCSRSEQVAQTLGLTEMARIGILRFVQEQCGEHLEVLRVGGMDPLQACADALDRLRLKLIRMLLNEQAFGLNLGVTFIRDLCRKTTALVPSLENFRITFLLDDYTSHRLSPQVQAVLNAILWQRDSSHVFKISSEPHGFDSGHVDNAKIDANREFVLVDAGQLTIGADENIDRRRFVTELLDKRLQTAKYQGTAETLIGPSEYPEDTDLADAIRGEKGKRVGQKTYYHGLHVLSNAWSGDVATVLHMLREMFARAKVHEKTSQLISHKIQHQSIVQVSTALRSRINGYHPYGAEMAKILATYGDLARRLLVEAPAVDKKSNRRIHRKYRIEMSLPTGADLEAELRRLHNGENMVALMRELVRRAVFVELPSSRGKESAARRTLRWQVRASLLPSFGTSLVRKNYIDVKRIEDFAEFLTNPDAFATKAYERYAASPGLFSNLLPDEDDE